MSILKIIKNKSLGQKAKHASLMPEATFNDAPRLAHSREYYPYFWGTVALFAMGLAALGGGAYWLLERDGRSKEKAHVYFEIKAVDEGGHPIAGAQVYNQKKQLGVTDSFGEWRKFYAVPLGSSVSLTLRKQTAFANLTARKNFAVPLEPPAKGDIVVGGSVKLLPPATLQGPRQRSTEARSLPMASIGATSELSARGVAAGVAGQTPPAENAAAAQLAQSDAAIYQSVWFRVIESQFQDPAAAKRQKLLQRYVVGALQRHSKRAGLQLNASSRWQVGLMHVPYPEGGAGFPGVVRVIASRAYGNEKIDFLANYTGQAASTAVEIMQGLAAHRSQRFVASRQGGAWYLKTDPVTVKSWRLGPGSHVFNSAGGVLQLGPAEGSLAYTFKLDPLQTQGAEACPKATPCLVSLPYIPKHPPAAGWGPARMKVYGVNPGQVDVYVAGYQAQHEGQNIWKYWVRPGQSVYLSVLKNGSMIYRKKFIGNQPSSTITSVPSPALSHK